jgi:hypothetical protein
MITRSFTRILIGLCLLLGGSAILSAQGLGTAFARLSGQQEAHPVATPATGFVTAEIELIDLLTARITVSGSFENLSSPVDVSIGGGAHVHIGYPGQNGGIAFPLVPTLAADSLSGTFDPALNSEIVSLLDFLDVDLGELYVNIHTRNYPGGELRGIVYDSENEAFFANLFGSNEVPAVITRATGALHLELNSENELAVTGSFNNLTDTLATDILGGVHLHLGLPGQNGGVAIVLNPTVAADGRNGVFESDNNIFVLTEQQATALRNGQYYANIHSGAFRNGEIRGQVLPYADQVFRAHLSGANEWPVVTSGGAGQVLGHVIGDTLRIIGSFSGLGSKVAEEIGGGFHLHTGVAGMNGGVIIPLNATLTADSLSGTFPLADNRYDLTADSRAALFNRGIYLNIHTDEHNPGEIRGQMLPECQAVFTAFLNGNQQIPSVTTTGRGMVKAEMRGNLMTATGSFSALNSGLNTEIAGGAHIHAGYPGQNGPVIFPLTTLPESPLDLNGTFMPAANTFPILDSTADSLMQRFFYVNIHSLLDPGGEIRGNLLAEAESYFLAPLSGASEPQGVATDATGFVAAEVVDTTVTLVGSLAGLESDFAFDVAGGAHLHNAIAGSNGGIVRGINTEIDAGNRSGVILADSNRIALSPAELQVMLDRGIYVNVHTEANGGGEIRGQVLPLAGSYFHTSFSGLNAATYVESPAQGGLKLELIDTTLVVSGSVTMLDGDFDANVAGGAHLHLGSVGQTGGISVGLNPTVATDLKSATFVADDNTFPLMPDQVQALRESRLYANIHTTTVGSGEARGQILGEMNLFPSASEILLPPDGTNLTLDGNAATEFRPVYSEAGDPDGDTLVYIWQLAADADFATILFATNTGRDSFFLTDFGTVDALLESAGVEVGNSITLYHRVLTSDGSNQRAGAGAAVTLERGTVVGIEDYRPEGFQARTYPNLIGSGQPVTFEVQSQERFRGQLMIINQYGQILRETRLSAQGGQQVRQLATDQLPGGQYIVALRLDNGRIIYSERLVVQ